MNDTCWTDAAAVEKSSIDKELIKIIVRSWESHIVDYWNAAEELYSMC